MTWVCTRFEMWLIITTISESIGCCVMLKLDQSYPPLTSSRDVLSGYRSRTPSACNSCQVFGQSLAQASKSETGGACAFDCKKRKKATVLYSSSEIVRNGKWKEGDPYDECSILKDAHHPDLLSSLVFGYRRLRVGSIPSGEGTHDIAVVSISKR